MHPPLALDIGWRDLLSVLFARRPGELAAYAPHGRTAVVGLSVRTLWDVLLAELDLGPGDEVLMSAINIEGMAAIVRDRGLTPAPVDIDPATLAPTAEAFTAAVTPRTRVFLMAHLFGAVARLERYAAVCRERGVLLVEDRAQAFAGGLEADPAADVSLYSFGPIKTATALGGAVALFADPALAARVRARLDALPELTDAWFLRRTAKYALLKLASGPLFYGLLLHILSLLGRYPEAAIAGAVRGFGSSGDLSRIRRRPPARLLALLTRRLAQSRSPDARRARALEVLQASGHPWPGRSAPRHTFWLAPVLSADPDGLAHVLRRNGFGATRGLTSLRALEGAPAARRLLDEALHLPLSPYLSPRALRLLASLLAAHAPSREAP